MKSIKKSISKNKPLNSHFQFETDALKTENLKLQRQIFKLKAEHISLNSIITILKENTNQRCVHDTPPIECLIKSKQLLDEKIKNLHKKYNISEDELKEIEKDN